MDYTFFQEYWWLLISILGALLVFGQSMLLQDMPDEQREKMVYAIAHRWELTFTTLVVFGGAFFASFPLFYSTSFGGAYWLWMLILFGFVVQAVSYKYRSAEGNILGRKTYDVFLFLNGIIAPVLLGGAVSTRHRLLSRNGDLFMVLRHLPTGVWWHSDLWCYSSSAYLPICGLSTRLTMSRPFHGTGNNFALMPLSS